MVRALQEEGWVVCRAFKKRTMQPPRSSIGAWEASYSYHDPAVFVGGGEHFKQEAAAELDCVAAAAGANAFLRSRKPAGPPDDDDMAALLLLDGGGQEDDAGRWLGSAGLLSAVAADATTDCGLGTSCVPGDIN
ncbi:hypothetical protein OsJ_32255 [Oryza sativa Japonica Group]|uniref:Uncharacterized protein n=1 Tax=Oryza sativa subsp. japonica TaxID=39947 RepID=B9G6Q6_ORYSJ|nr:hypothetical protein OsJ_32255 [Oryza sativa Japonica Group]